MHERQEEEANDNKRKTKRVDTVPDKGRVVHSGYSPLLKTSGKQKQKRLNFLKKKLLVQARLRLLLLLLPAAHSMSYLLQNLHKMNFLQST